MNKLTIRGFDDALKNPIQQLAHREGLSLNQTPMKLLRLGAGMPQPEGSANAVGSALDHLIGTSTAEEAAEIEQALEELSKIDETLRT